MKELRVIRIFLAVLFFIGAVVYLTVSHTVHPALKVVEQVQIIPSMIAVSLGAILVWIVITFFLGRVYCSTVCPVGTYQDIIIRLRSRIPALRKPFSYRRPARMRYYVLAIYIFCLLIGVAAVPFWIEPWSIMSNICATVHPSEEVAVWMRFGVGTATGILAGIVSAVLLAICAFFTGRGFCTDICPIGTALGCFNDFTLYHIEIDPDRCIYCMKCEEVCKSQCVKVVGSLVDNSRCVRCFNCLHVCPNDAIRFQINRNRRATPLMTKAGPGKAT